MTPAVTLRQPREGDAADRLALGDDPGIMRMFGVDPAALPPLDEARTARWVQGLADHPCAWVVEHAGRLLGEARLDAIHAGDGRAQLAVGLYDSTKLGLGLGRQTVRLVLHHAFDALRLHRVGLRVIAYNTRALRCYTACGFRLEGREREAALVGQERHDDLLMGILAHEFAGSA